MHRIRVYGDISKILTWVFLRTNGSFIKFDQRELNTENLNVVSTFLYSELNSLDEENACVQMNPYMMQYIGFGSL